MNRAGLLLPPLLLLASCASLPKDPYVTEPGNPAWPLPPEIPRVEYVTSLERHTDLFRSGNIFSSIIRYTFGEEDTAMVRPQAIAIYPGGGLLVTDPGIGRVHFLDRARRRYNALGADLDGGLPSPVGVAVAADGSILVSDSRRRTIERFDEDGRSTGPFAPSHHFQRPGGIAVHPGTGEVYAADILAHRIVVFDSEGRLLRAFGGNGDQPGMFNFPTQLALTADGDLLVSDSMNFRIQLLAPDGRPLEAFGEPGNARGNFARPKGVAGLGGGIHAAIEGLYDSLVFFDRNGNLLLTIGEAGSGPGQFWLPAGLAVDRAEGLLFIADSYNSRVQVLRMLPEGDSGEGTETKRAVQP